MGNIDRFITHTATANRFIEHKKEIGVSGEQNCPCSKTLNDFLIDDVMSSVEPRCIQVLLNLEARVLFPKD